MDDIFCAMERKWPSAVVTRKEVFTFTGGLLRGSYLANLDAQKKGPPRLRIQQKWVYPVKELAEWLRQRSVD
ncbi:hypothetical protein [Desulfonatronum parangueonense]